MKNRKKINPTLVISIVLGIVATALFLIGGKLAGWEIGKWFISPTAILFYMLLVMAGLGIVFYIWKEKQ